MQSRCFINDLLSPRWPASFCWRLPWPRRTRRTRTDFALSRLPQSHYSFLSFSGNPLPAQHANIMSTQANDAAAQSSNRALPANTVPSDRLPRSHTPTPAGQHSVIDLSSPTKPTKTAPTKGRRSDDERRLTGDYRYGVIQSLQKRTSELTLDSVPADAVAVPDPRTWCRAPMTKKVSYHPT